MKIYGRSRRANNNRTQGSLRVYGSFAVALFPLPLAGGGGNDGTGGDAHLLHLPALQHLFGMGASEHRLDAADGGEQLAAAGKVELAHHVV